MITCTYNNVPFQFPTPEARSALDRYDWFDDLEVAPPYGQVWPGARLLRLGPTHPPRQAPPRLNEYFYPVGASRWSVYRGLMTAANVAGLPASGPFVIGLPATAGSALQTRTLFRRRCSCCRLSRSWAWTARSYAW
jgi:hypothetical protein